MKRSLCTLLALALTTATVASVAVAVAVTARLTPTATVYTVAQVRAGLAHDPGAWAGRTVLVRGVIMRCLRVEGCSAIPAGIPHVGLVDGIPIIEMPRATVLSQSLPLLFGPDPLRASLRQVPLLRGLVPPPRRLDLTGEDTYAVHLVTLTPCTVANSHRPCVAALLTDTTGG